MARGQDWVLLVEDDRVFARALSRCVFTKARLEVAPTLAAAQQRLAVEPNAPRALVVDVNLPDGNGLEFAASVRAGFPTLPLMVISGDVAPCISHRALELRAALLLKPFSSAPFMLFLDRALCCAACESHDVAVHVAGVAAVPALSTRERQVLELAMRGHGRRAMALSLGISEATIKTMIARLLRKCAAPSLSVLVSRAWSSGAT